MTTLATNRLPQGILVQIGSRVRDQEKRDDRTLDIKSYVDILTDHVNMLKLTRVSISDPHPQQTTRNPLVRQPHRSHKEMGLPANQQYGGERKVQKACMVCQSTDHWITGCPTIRGLAPDAILKKIQNAGGCTICLRRGHKAKDCNSKEKQSCYYCKERGHPGANTHRKLVCPKKPTTPAHEAAAVSCELPPNFYD